MDSPEQEQPPASKFVLDLDQHLQCQALVESLELLENPPVELLRAGNLRAFRAQLLLRLSYLSMHCSVPSSSHLRGELQKAGLRQQALGQSLLAAERALEIARRNSRSLGLR